MSINEHESDGDIVSKKPLLDEHLDKSKPTKEKTPLLEHPTHQHESILFAFHQLPEYLKDNAFILTGYRVNYGAKNASMSCFRMHNESWNIWTHLGGFLLFFLFMFITPTQFMINPSASDVIVFSVFLIAAQCQMLFSAIFHWFGCMNPTLASWLARLDYTGISIMIVGSYYPPLWYGFQCYPGWRAAYLTGISIFGVIGILIGSLPFFATPRHRVTRAVFFIVFGFSAARSKKPLKQELKEGNDRITRTVFFIIFGCSAIIPFPHLMFLEGYQKVFPYIWREFLMGMTYVTGAVLYSTRFPERKWPGAFDYFGSHVLFHIATIIAACTQLYVCLYVYYDYIGYVCQA